ncbi:MAG: PepSY-like domain-containing protein [Bacteroidota bacterium]
MRIYILFFLMLLSACAFSQKIDEDQVPKDVLIAIETVYSGAKVKTWELKDNNYFATVKVDGQTGKAEITPEGKWLSTKFNVSEKELPSSVTSYLSDNFDGYKIKQNQYVEDNEEKNYYVLRIAKKGISSGDEYELTFDTKGNLKNSTAPESAKTEKKKAGSDEDADPPKRDKVSKKEVNNDDEDTKTEDKKAKTSKSSKSTKEPVASKTKSKKDKDNEDEDTNDDKPVKKTTAKKVTTSSSSSSDRSSANKTKTQRSTSSGSTKTKKMSLSDGDDEGTSGSGSAPGVVKKTFEKKFPKNEKASWIKVDSNFVVSFVFRDIDQKAEFTPDAKLVSTTTAMEPKNLFRPLENYLEKNYKKYKVTSADKIVYNSTYAKQFPEKKLKNYFVVKISQKMRGSKKPKITTIFFDSKGGLDRIEEGDFEDQDQGDEDSSPKKKSKKNDDSEDE